MMFAGVWAAAAGLTINSQTLAAGSTTVGGCTGSVNVSYNVAFSGGDYRVTSVVVSGITPIAACQNKALSVTLFTTGNASVGTGSVAVVGGTGTETVTIASQPLASAVTGVSVIFNG